MDETKNNKFLTVEEVASLLRKKERTIREWCYCRTIPHYKVGNSLLFRKDEILEWVNGNCRVEISNTADGQEEPERHQPLKLKIPKLQIKEIMLK